MVRSESLRLAAHLTRRQQQTLELVAAGCPNKVIAQDLGLSERTVRTHLERLFRKLGVHTRTEAVVANDAMEVLRLMEENRTLKRVVADLSLANRKLTAARETSKPVGGALLPYVADRSESGSV